MEQGAHNVRVNAIAPGAVNGRRMRVYSTISTSTHQRLVTCLSTSREGQAWASRSPRSSLRDSHHWRHRTTRPARHCPAQARVPAEQLVALVLSPVKTVDLGIRAREAGHARPETLAGALAGIDTLLLISSIEVGQRAVLHHNVIDAAKQAGAKRIVYTSLLGADTSPLSLAPEHREAENMLKAAGVPFTILGNGWYTENCAGSIVDALADGAFIGSAGDGKISSAARADFAEAAALVLSSAGHDGKSYELAGGEAYTLRISPPKSRARPARQPRTRTCPRPTMLPLCPASACQPNWRKRSPAGTSARRRRRCSTTVGSLPR